TFLRWMDPSGLTQLTVSTRIAFEFRVSWFLPLQRYVLYAWDGRRSVVTEMVTDRTGAGSAIVNIASPVVLVVLPGGPIVTVANGSGPPHVYPGLGYPSHLPAPPPGASPWLPPSGKPEIENSPPERQ